MTTTSTTVRLHQEQRHQLQQQQHQQPQQPLLENFLRTETLNLILFPSCFLKVFYKYEAEYFLVF